MRRREFLAGAAALAGLAAFGAIAWRPGRGGAAAASGHDFEVTRSEAEWRSLLTAEQYRVLRDEGTERAFSSPLDKETRAGMFHCAGCDNPVYSSRTKYDSGTGWPSFWAAEEGGIGTRDDRAFLMLRTECHCARCGGHLGHVFDDGPQPTGKRHCINGVAMTFRPGEAVAG